MAKPNYAFEKRQKEIAKKQKKQEKQLQKATKVEHAEPEPAVTEGTGAVPEQNSPSQPGGN